MDRFKRQPIRLLLLASSLLATLAPSQQPTRLPLWSAPGAITLESQKTLTGLAVPLPLPDGHSGFTGNAVSLASDNNRQSLWIGRADGLFRWEPASATLTHLLPNVQIDDLQLTGSILWVLGTKLSGKGNWEDQLSLFALNPADGTTILAETTTGQASSYALHALHTAEIGCCIFVSIASTSETKSFLYNKRAARLQPLPYSVYHLFGSGPQAVVVKGLNQQIFSMGARPKESIELCHVDAGGALIACKDTGVGRYNPYTEASIGHSSPPILFDFDGTSVWILNRRLGTNTHWDNSLSEVAQTDFALKGEYPVRDESTADFSGFRSLTVAGDGILLTGHDGFAWFDRTTRSLRPVDIPSGMPFLHNGATQSWLWSRNDFSTAARLDQNGEFKLYRFNIPKETSPLFADDGTLVGVNAYTRGTIWQVDVTKPSIQQLPWESRIVSVRDIASVAGISYFASSFRVMQWEPASSIAFKLEPSPQSLLQRTVTSILSGLTGREVVSDGVVGIMAAYARQTIPGLKSIDLKPADDQFSARIRQDQLPVSPELPVTEAVRIPITLGTSLLWRNTDLEFDVSDALGNQQTVHRRVLIVSSLLTSTVGFYLLFSAIMLLVLLAAPYNNLANNFIMSPFLRNWGTLLAVPALLALVPPLRRHLLKRYRRSLEQQLAAPAGIYIVPDPALDFSRVAALFAQSAQPILLHGPSGIGKSAWLNHACHAVVGTNPPTILARDLPVLVRLRDYQAMEPRDVFFEELKARGKFGDSDLAAEFLRQGGVLFFIDGLNEVADTIQARWIGFARANAGTHRFLFTSQNLPALDGRETLIQVPELSDDSIRRIVQLQASGSAQLLQGLTPRSQALLRNPANLLVVLHLIEQGQPVPETEFELYRQVVAPLRQRWTQLGTASYLDDLRSIAASFAQTGQADVFSGRQLPDEQELLRARILIKKNDRLFFLSDRIAAFLVAETLLEFPSTLSEMKPVLSGQWRLILEMVGQRVDAATAGILVDALIQTATSSGLALAEYLVAACQTESRPGLNQPWSEQKLIAIARARQRQTLAQLAREAQLIPA